MYVHWRTRYKVPGTWYYRWYDIPYSILDSGKDAKGSLIFSETHLHCLVNISTVDYI